jgi:hypothetical protein
MPIRLTLYTNGRPVAALPNLPTSMAGGTLSGGSAASTVTFDTTASVLRTASLTVIDTTGALVPGVGGNTFLMPAGNEIFVEKTDAAGNWVPMGLFGIVTTDVNDSADTPGPVVTLALSDRAFVLGQSCPTSTIQFAAGTPIEAATYQLLNGAVSWIPDWCYQLDSTGATLTAQIVDAGANPWTTASGWWTSVGGVLYPDENGNIVGTVLTPSPVPSRVYNTLGDDLTSAVTVTFDASSAYNGVTVAGTNPSAIPVQATAWDTDTTSPTFYLGPFGQRPAPTVQSDTATTADQCFAAALGLLPQYLGLARTVETTLLPDPHLKPWMTAQITSARDGVSGRWYAQSGTHTLDDSTGLTVTWVPAGQPLDWGQSYNSSAATQFA